MQVITQARESLSCVEACKALGASRASFYRSRKAAASVTPEPGASKRPRAASPRALTEPERAQVLEVLHDERFADLAVPQVYATLLDGGEYLCSMRSMYRILGDHGEVRERRNQLRRPTYAKPELLATGPNQVWSWDITKLRGPAKWNYFHLYVILDIFSRKVVGWMVAPRESASLAEKLIEAATSNERIEPGQLTIHADRGSSMTSKDVALLLADLGVTKTHSRPHVSDDNPYSEAHFKTLKYRPDFPDRFGSEADARAFCRRFFDWYNQHHRHSGIGWHTPVDVHDGRAEQVRVQRGLTLNRAYQLHPERFVRRPPTPPTLPSAAWINKPAAELASGAH